MNLEHKTVRPQGIITCGKSQWRALIVTAVSVERDAVFKALNGDPRFDVLMGGVGPVAAAVNTTRALATADYSLVINVGIAGGFPGKAEVGSLVVATEIVSADLGAETPEGFKSLDDLGFGSTRIRTEEGLVDKVTSALRIAKLPVNIGPVLTVSTVTGTDDTTIELATRIEGATAEAMEGFGVGFAALDHKLPFLEIRSISNMVGPRDGSAWKIKEALVALEAACKVLTEVLP